MVIAFLPAAVFFPQSPRRVPYDVESSCFRDSGSASRPRRCCGGPEYGQHGFVEFQPQRERQQQVLGQRLRRCFEQLVLAEQLLVLTQQLLVLAEQLLAEGVFAELFVFVVLAERFRRRELERQLDPVVLRGRQEQRRLDLPHGVGRVLQQVGQQLLERRHVQHLAQQQLAEQQLVFAQQQLVAEQQL